MGLYGFILFFIAKINDFQDTRYFLFSQANFSQNWPNPIGNQLNFDWLILLVGAGQRHEYVTKGSVIFSSGYPFEAFLIFFFIKI